jgi:sarcosine oxidase, subunit delta
MLRIKCPWCGVRDEQEFTYGGEAQIERPSPEASDIAWAAYLWLRRNSEGTLHERWLHAFGCNQWFNVVRDTVTHEVSSVYELSTSSLRLQR